MNDNDKDKDEMPKIRRKNHPVIGEGKSSLLTNPSIGRAAAALAMYEGGKQIWNTGSAWYKEHMVYSVTVEETDYAYADVHEWLLELLPTDRQRALVASTVSRRDMMFVDDDSVDDRKPTSVRLSFNDRRAKRLDVDGFKIMARVSRSEDVPENSSAKKPPMCIEFTSHTKAGQEAVIKQLQRIQAQKGIRKPVLRIVNQWGSWVRRSDLPLRDLDSVILPVEQKSDLVTDLGNFLAAEEQYVKLALPWHRGYMLHGRPGTGKTSIIKALANEFKLDLWYVSLGDLKEEASLINLLSEVSPRSILLLEDVDTIQFTHNRDETAEKPKTGNNISLSSLLNALDGVATPHGLITFMTTNHFDKLDDALVRAGRMDRVEELVYPTALEVDKLYRRFYGAPLPDWEPGAAEMPFSQADLSEAFKRNLEDPEGAAKAVQALVARGL